MTSEITPPFFISSATAKNESGQTVGLRTPATQGEARAYLGAIGASTTQ